MRFNLMPRWLVAVVTALVTAFVCMVVVPALTGTPGAAPQATSVCGGAAVAADASTPKKEWKKGELPYLYQIDPEWAQAPYADATIKEAGCGPTALSMVYVCLTGKKDMSPKKMAQFSEENGYVEAGATRWTFMDEGAARLGMNAIELSASAVKIEKHLDQGEPIICILGPGDFTETGHFIVLAKNLGDGKVEIRDPNSPAKSHVDWSLKRILSQTRNLWAYSI